MTERPDRFEEVAHIRARVRQAGAQFLLTELRAGLALLDVAETGESGESRERRRALALEAYEVVSDRLARTGTNAVVLLDEERDEIACLHVELGRRLRQ